MRKLLFKLLGINFASEGSKAPPFSDCFKTLGLVVDTENVGNREVKVGHTEERSKELLECIDEILSHNSVGTKTWKDCRQDSLVSHLCFWEETERGHQGPVMALEKTGSVHPR